MTAGLVSSDPYVTEKLYATMPLLPPLIDVSDPAVLKDRIKAARIAERRGYFWLPCGLCGTYYGGQEWATDSDADHPPHVPDPAGELWSCQGICPWCTAAGRGWDWPEGAGSAVPIASITYEPASEDAARG